MYLQYVQYKTILLKINHATTRSTVSQLLSLKYRVYVEQTLNLFWNRLRLGPLRFEGSGTLLGRPHQTVEGVGPRNELIVSASFNDSSAF